MDTQAAQIRSPFNDAFSDALISLRHGAMVARHGWNGKGMYLQLQVPDEKSKMQQPNIYTVPRAEYVIPWVASQADLLTDDWVIVE